MQRNTLNSNKMTLKYNTTAKLLKTFDQQFKIVIFTQKDDLIGSGSFGKCYLGILKNNQCNQTNYQLSPSLNAQNNEMNLEDIKHKLVVVKQIRKKKQKGSISQQELYKKQIQNLSLATQLAKFQKNIVHCYPYTFCSDSNYYIVMEYCDNKSLSNLIKKRQYLGRWFNFYQFLKIFVDIIYGYYPLHHLKIMHQDLKPDNIFIKGKNFKIGDFGLSFVINKSNVLGRGGTQNYNGIEKYIDSMNISHKSDLYAIGVILFQLFYKAHPYYQKHQKQYFRDEVIEQKKKENINILKIKNQKQILSPRQQMEFFIKFYQSRKIKQKKPHIQKPLKNQKIERDFGINIEKLYDQAQELIKRMVNKDIKTRPSFTELYHFIKQNKIDKLITSLQQKEYLRELDISFFSQFLQNACQNIQLPFNYSDIGNKVCFEQQSNIMKQQIQIRKSLLRQSKLKKQRQEDLNKKYPRVFGLKLFTQHVNTISRVLMDVYHYLSTLDFQLVFNKNRNNQTKTDIQSQTVQLNQKIYYEEKKIELQFVVQKYLLSFLVHINKKINRIIKGFNQEQLLVYYKQNIDSLVQIIQKNEQYLRSELFITENEISSFDKNEQDLERVLCDQFLKGIGLDEKNILMAYYSLMILKLKDQIAFQIKQYQACFHSEQFTQLGTKIDYIQNQWNQTKKINTVKNSSQSEKLKIIVIQELKKKNLNAIIFFQ